jgi:hypothetical protein
MIRVGRPSSHTLPPPSGGSSRRTIPPPSAPPSPQPPPRRPLANHVATAGETIRVELLDTTSVITAPLPLELLDPMALIGIYLAR